MNRIMTLTALLSLFCATAQAADVTSQPSPEVPAATTTSTTTITTTQPTNATTATTPATPVAQTPQVVDCQYKISSDTTKIDQTLVSTWAEKATIQSFDFSPTALDDQLVKLKNCFTDQGWQGFNDALQKSGNVNAIKSQNLTVSSQVDGNIQISEIKDNQWKITVPMQVVYQNDKEKLTQLLSVDLLVGRKVSGDLGIMQMIATPRTPAGAAPIGTPSPTPTTAPVATTTAPVAETSGQTTTSTQTTTTAPATTPASAPSTTSVQTTTAPATPAKK
jgi:hypothetical protein